MHRNNSSIAMHRDRIASWHVNRDTNRIVTSLAIPTPNMNAQWSYYDHNELGSTGIRFDENQHVFWYILVLYLDKHARIIYQFLVDDTSAYWPILGR